ncbi:MAG: hypothetical protein CMJ65_01105 [Planctomycetaceae bacterium]|nr:hypothetical protein [Planctomycetaceae bacterium]
MRSWLCAVVSLTVLALTTTATADDWPTYRHDSTRGGATADALVWPLTNHWTHRAAAALKTAWSGAEGRSIEGKDLYDRVRFDDALHVAIVNGRVYFGSSIDHRIHCVDAASGRSIWSTFTDAAVRLAPTIADGRLLVGSEDGYAWCLDAGSGKVLWRLRLGPADERLLARGEMIARWPVRTGILVDRGVAYFGAGIFPHENVYLAAVDVATGKPVWRNDQVSHGNAGRADLSPQGYLLASGDDLYFPSGRAKPSVVDRKTGRIAGLNGWRGSATSQTLSLSSGHVAGTNAVILGGKLYSYTLGSQVAGTAEATYVTTGETVARLDRKVYNAVNTRRTKLKADLRTVFSDYRAKKIEKAEYLLRSEAVRKQINDQADAGVEWRVPSKANAAVIVTGSHVIAGGSNVVELFDTKTGKLAGRLKVEGAARGLAVSDGRLLVSTDTGRVHCFASGEAPRAVAAAKPVADPYPKDKWTAVYEQAAENILKQTGIRTGFCLVAGAEQGRLALALARRSGLKIYGVESDPKKVAAARRALVRTGLYGHRITIHEAAAGEIPYASYFANLVVSDTHLLTGRVPVAADVVAHHLKPCGGTVCLGGDHPFADDWRKDLGLEKQSITKRGGDFTLVTRGKLPGAGSWSHQYGDPGNTACSDDQLVRGGLGVLWYGDPGPGKMVNRHDGAVGPVSTFGRLFIQGTDSLLAYDAYNGQFLWEFKNEKAVRTGVFQNHAPGNLVASDESVFMMLDARCLQLDAATGKLQKTHSLPAGKNAAEQEWGYIALSEGILFGTSTRRKRLELVRSRRGKQTEDATDAIFAIDLKTGKHLWSYQGKSIDFRTIALGPERVHFINSTITAEQRQALLREDKTELKSLKGEAAKRAEARLKRIDGRTAIALDARTGKQLWAQAVDVTDTSEIGIGGGRLSMVYKDGVLLMGGANANGHYWTQFIAGEFKQRRLVALSAVNGYKLWSKDANYRHRPIVVGNKIIAEPWSFDLKSGKQTTRIHPLTGKEVPWSFMRPGHHCGMNTAAPNMLFFRSGFTAFYDLQSDSGTRHFAGHRLGCWINAIPANGLVMIPEASAGCVCLFSIASTVVMEPRKPRRPWGIYSGVGTATPVKQLALNLGAPGDRRDATGKLWLSYPRPKSNKTTGLELNLDLGEMFAKGGKFVSRDGDASEESSRPEAWVFSSSAQGITKCSLPLRGTGDKPARYTVRLYFAANKEKPGQRVFDVQVQGKVVLKDFDVAKANRNGTAVREIPGVIVTGQLKIELVPKHPQPTADHQPMLSGIEVAEVTGGS